MSQIAFAGSAEVIAEDYYDYECPPNLTIRLDIAGHVYRLQLLNDPRKRHYGCWYNNTYIAEVIEGHV